MPRAVVVVLTLIAALSDGAVAGPPSNRERVAAAGPFDAVELAGELTREGGWLGIDDGEGVVWLRRPAEDGSFVHRTVAERLAVLPPGTYLELDARAVHPTRPLAVAQDLTNAELGVELTARVDRSGRRARLPDGREVPLHPLTYPGGRPAPLIEHLRGRRVRGEFLVVTDEDERPAALFLSRVRARLTADTPLYHHPDLTPEEAGDLVPADGTVAVSGIADGAARVSWSPRSNEEHGGYMPIARLDLDAPAPPADDAPAERGGLAESLRRRLPGRD